MNHLNIQNVKYRLNKSHVMLSGNKLQFLYSMCHITVNKHNKSHIKVFLRGNVKE